jgi:5-formyltetrahydrofolate cyclo-ligase
MNKNEVRLFYRNLLDNLPLKRKKEAQENAFSSLYNKISKASHILSFASMQEEIDLWQLNLLLAKEKKLLLPRVEGKELGIYYVNDVSKLKKNESYEILEPTPPIYQKAMLDDIEVVLVPALAFDKNNYRLGRGGGFYDRLLPKLKAQSIGIGFKEQLTSHLPTESFDRRVDELMLF